MKPRKGTTRPGRDGSSRATRRGAGKTSSFRLDPRLRKGLAWLATLRRVPLTRLVNEAVAQYLEVHAAARGRSRGDASAHQAIPTRGPSLRIRDL